MKRNRTIKLLVLLCALLLLATGCGGKSENTVTVGMDSEKAAEINARYDTTDTFKVFYTWEYPAKFAKQRNEMFALFEEFERDGGLKENPDLILVKSKIGLKHKFIAYIVGDSATDDDVYLYYGSAKDGVPDGAGILFDTEVGLPEFAGYFDKGKVNGYGIIFKTGHMAFESEKCKYKGSSDFYANGDSIQYQRNTSQVYENAYVAAYQEAGYSVLKVPSVLSIAPSVIYEGEMSNSKSSGEGKEYYPIYREGATSTETVYGPLRYDGEWKRDAYHGDGKLYSETGTLAYEGKFRNGKIKN